MSEQNKVIGIIAGGGQFPLMVADAIRKQGLHVVAVAHHEETDPELANRVDKIVWIRVGQLGQLIKALKTNGIRKALMSGTISKRLMFKVKPDLKGLTLISRLAIFHDDGILRSLAREFEKDGIQIVSAADYVPELLTPQGCLTRRRPTRKEEEDIELGWHIAKELGKLDIGQCVVVRRGTVLALEAMEGTDETILRGGKLAREKAIVVKVSKPDQDMRFDIPSVGLKTVETMRKVKASVLALEAGKTLMFDKSEMIRMANGSGISIVSEKGY